MKHEYRTNESKRFLSGTAYPVPEPPSDADWFLVSSFPKSVDDAGGTVMVWTWGRSAKRRTVECPTDGCASLARKNGKCIACGAEIPVEN